MRKLRRAREDWRNGRRYGYPLCCVLTYVLGPLLGRDHGAKRRGSCRTVPGDDRPTAKVWVPCRWHQRHGPHWEAYGAQAQRMRSIYSRMAASVPPDVRTDEDSLFFQFVLPAVRQMAEMQRLLDQLHDEGKLNNGQRKQLARELARPPLVPRRRR